jgi:hypothetical protein
VVHAVPTSTPSPQGELGIRLFLDHDNPEGLLERIDAHGIGCDSGVMFRSARVNRGYPIRAPMGPNNLAHDAAQS